MIVFYVKHQPNVSQAGLRKGEEKHEKLRAFSLSFLREKR